ncbi:MAG: type II toxin-antitoxin system RelB/DinJ family antitoxin [Candidatus Yonathbacteria bacterium]|nr:type II toxin-antitoxin system RelB/DinJ family antitoxin [Candidatus Yonathbacteria bacterium]
MSTTKNKTAIVAFRTHQDVKDRVNKVLARSGLDTSTVLNMVMQNIAISGKSPVSLDRVMSPKLIKIIRDVEKEDKSKRKIFTSTKDALAFLKTI